MIGRIPLRCGSRWLVPAVVGCVIGACGATGPSDEERVFATLTRFNQATASRDYPTICNELLAPELVDDLTAIGLPCPVALEQGLAGVRNPRMTIGRIAVSGERASAEVRTAATGQAPSHDVVELVRVGDSWRIAALRGTAASDGVK